MLVRFKYLQEQGIIPDRMALARAIQQYGFPAAIELGKNKVAWDLDEVQAWVASRPRRRPKCGKSKQTLTEAASITEAV